MDYISGDAVHRDVCTWVLWWRALWYDSFHCPSRTATNLLHPSSITWGNTAFAFWEMPVLLRRIPGNFVGHENSGKRRRYELIPHLSFFSHLTSSHASNHFRLLHHRPEEHIKFAGSLARITTIFELAPIRWREFQSYCTVALPAGTPCAWFKPKTEILQILVAPISTP